jgi:hypothetical protein
MQINRTKRKVTAGKKLVRQPDVITASEQSQKVVKSAIDQLGTIMSSCKTPEEKQAVQGAIANMSVVLLELKK